MPFSWQLVMTVLFRVPVMLALRASSLSLTQRYEVLVFRIRSPKMRARWLFKPLLLAPRHDSLPKSPLRRLPWRTHELRQQRPPTGDRVTYYRLPNDTITTLPSSSAPFIC